MNRILVVVDAVKGFISEGPFANPRTVNKVDNIVSLCELFRCDNIVFLKDCHSNDAIEFNTYIPHCIKGSLECELDDKLVEFEKLQNAISFKKNSTNGLMNREIRKYFEKLLINKDGYKNLEIHVCGFITEVCVMQFVLSLNSLINELNINGVSITVHKNAIDTFDAPGHNADDINEFVFNNFKQNGIKVV